MGLRGGKGGGEKRDSIPLRAPEMTKAELDYWREKARENDEIASTVSD